MNAYELNHSQDSIFYKFIWINNFCWFDCKEFNFILTNIYGQRIVFSDIDLSLLTYLIGKNDNLANS